MPSTSPTGPELVDHGPVAERTIELDGYTLNYVTFKERVDMTGMLASLPDGMCQCPHWGVVDEGSFTVRYGDGHEESVGTGEAFYMPPGHVPTFEAGSQVTMFSPTDELKATDEAIMAAMAASGA